MRPVRRGPSPQDGDFKPFRRAFPFLVGRLGGYCSYCERPILTQLAVEHVQPKKGPHGHPHLIGAWENFLLSCVNCNSTKSVKQVRFESLLFPDRDNTDVAFVYLEDGGVRPSDGLSPGMRQIARDTLALTGLDKRPSPALDGNEQRVAIERVSQRLEARLMAQTALDDFETDSGSEALQRSIARTAKSTGFFSIWMDVFAGHSVMRQRFIDAFPGTRESGCFDTGTTTPVSPAPNPDGLPHGGKT